MFVLADVTVGREPFEELSTGASPALNHSTSPLQTLVEGVISPAINSLSSKWQLHGQSQVSSICDYAIEQPLCQQLRPSAVAMH